MVECVKIRGATMEPQKLPCHYIQAWALLSLAIVGIIWLREVGLLSPVGKAFEDTHTCKQLQPSILPSHPVPSNAPDYMHGLIPSMPEK